MFLLKECGNGETGGASVVEIWGRDESVEEPRDSATPTGSAAVRLFEGSA